MPIPTFDHLLDRKIDHHDTPSDHSRGTLDGKAVAILGICTISAIFALASYNFMRRRFVEHKA